MQRFFENKLAFAAILLLFALAMVCNATIGGFAIQGQRLDDYRRNPFKSGS